MKNSEIKMSLFSNTQLYRYSYKQTAVHIGGLVQDCNNSIAYTLELLQSCTEPLI